MSWGAPLDYEYLKAANPRCRPCRFKPFPAISFARAHASHPLRNANDLKTRYPATSPNCLVSYVRLCAGECLTTDIKAGSHLFYVLRGNGQTTTEHGAVAWASDDTFTLPVCEQITHTATEDAAMYWVSDFPLLHYLSATPTRNTFQPVHYPAAWLATIQGAATANRIGILLANALNGEALPGSAKLYIHNWDDRLRAAATRLEVFTEKVFAAAKSAQVRLTATRCHLSTGDDLAISRNMVPRDRIELSTPAFSGLCSAN